MNTAIAIFVMLHGLVHAILLLAPHPDRPEAPAASFFSRSWLLNAVSIGEPAGKSIAILLVAIATVGFAAAGMALLEFLLPLDGWRTLAIASAAASLLLLGIFWHRYVIIGVLINVLILAATIILKWTPEW